MEIYKIWQPPDYSCLQSKLKEDTFNSPILPTFSPKTTKRKNKKCLNELFFSTPWFPRLAKNTFQLNFHCFGHCQWFRCCHCYCCSCCGNDVRIPKKSGKNQKFWPLPNKLHTIRNGVRNTKSQHTVKSSEKKKTINKKNLKNWKFD